MELLGKQIFSFRFVTIAKPSNSVHLTVYDAFMISLSTSPLSQVSNQLVLSLFIYRVGAQLWVSPAIRLHREINSNDWTHVQKARQKVTSTRWQLSDIDAVNIARIFAHTPIHRGKHQLFTFNSRLKCQPLRVRIIYWMSILVLPV